MRLYPDEAAALRFALQDICGSIYLFGSRTNNEQKGGDIDILIYNDDEMRSNLDLSLAVSARFASQCDTAIDVIVVRKNALTREEAVFIATLNVELFN